jgi:YidC/Oxa1 family membrane protein insertase
MEKRLILAVVLMIATVFIVNVVFPPPPPPEPPVVEQETLGAPRDVADAVAETIAAQDPQPAAAVPAEVPQLAPAEDPEAEDTVWVTTPLYRIAFAQRGGRVVSARMSQFESLASDTKGELVELVPPYAESFFTHKWLVGDDTLDFSSVPFEISPARGLDLVEGGEPRTLTLSYRPEGVPFQLEIRYTFRPDRYVIDLVGRLEGVRGTGWWAMGLGPGLLSNEWDPENDYKQNLAFSGKGPEGISSQKVEDIQPGQLVILDGPFDWAAVRTKYFVNALVVPLEAADDRRFEGYRARPRASHSLRLQMAAAGAASAGRRYHHAAGLDAQLPRPRLRLDSDHLRHRHPRRALPALPEEHALADGDDAGAAADEGDPGEV